jgi:hypothetical protein
VERLDSLANRAFRETESAPEGGRQQNLQAHHGRTGRVRPGEVTMSEEDPKNEQADPMSSMMQFYEQWTQAWAKSLSETVASPRFAETMADQTEGSLEFWALVRRQVGEAMEQYLQQMSLPTQSEVVSLAERLTTIEMRLDDMDEKLDEILDQLKEKSGS